MKSPALLFGTSAAKLNHPGRSRLFASTIEGAATIEAAARRNELAPVERDGLVLHLFLRHVSRCIEGLVDAMLTPRQAFTGAADWLAVRRALSC